MRVIVDPFYSELGSRVVVFGGFDLLPLDFKLFPDGEFYVRVPSDVAGSNVAIIVGCMPFQQSDCFLRGVFLTSTLKDLGVKKVILVYPYLPYSRQDKRFLPGECVSARVFVNSLLSAGADVVVTIDVHSPDVFSSLGSRFVNISSLPVWRDYLKNNFVDGFFLIAPDEGRLEVVSKLAKLVGVPYTAFKKVRDLKSGKITSLEPVNADELNRLSKNNKTAIIFDDIISTGGTVAAACKIAKSQGAKKVYAACVHPLLVGNAYERIMNSGCDGIIGTDTIPSRVSKVSVAPLIAEVLRDELSG